MQKSIWGNIIFKSLFYALKMHKLQIYCALSITTMLIIYFAYTIFWGVFITLNENQLLYFFSTLAQITAGLFGLTIAGYIFFINGLDKRVVDDELSKEFQTAFKQIYFNTFIMIGILATISIVLSLLGILLLNKNYNFIYDLIINICGIVFINGIGLMIGFFFDIINPNREKMMIEVLEKQIVGSDKYSKRNGNCAEFVSDVGEIEEILNKYILFSNLNSLYNKVSLYKVTDIMCKNKVIDYLLYRDIKK